MSEILPHITDFKIAMEKASDGELGVASDTIAKMYKTVRYEVKKRRLGWSPGLMKGKRPEEYFTPYVITVATLSKRGSKYKGRGKWHLVGNDECTYLQNKKKVKNSVDMTAHDLIGWWNRHLRGNVKIHEKCRAKLFDKVREYANPDFKECSDCGKETYLYRWNVSNVVPICLACADRYDGRMQLWFKYRVRVEK